MADEDFRVHGMGVYFGDPLLTPHIPQEVRVCMRSKVDKGSFVFLEPSSFRAIWVPVFRPKVITGWGRRIARPTKVAVSGRNGRPRFVSKIRLQCLNLTIGVEFGAKVVEILGLAPLNAIVGAIGLSV